MPLSFGQSGSPWRGTAPAAEPIAPTPEYLQHFHSLVHSRQQQKSAGYVMERMSQQELDKKRRCGRCNMRHTNLPCKFHPGALDSRKQWTCCNRTAFKIGCESEAEHQVRIYAPGELEQRWRFEPTPTYYLNSSDTRRAVAIDCEMGTAYDGTSELIRVTMIDYFTGAVLVDKLVWPDVEMMHYNTRYSGVTRFDMQTALRAGTCIRGIRNAKAELWRFVGQDTIVVGHSAENDLRALRWIHSRVVDSFLIESALKKESDMREGDGNEKEKEGQPFKKRPEDGLSLKAMAMRKLGRAIQVGGRKGHDSLEDAIATRDLIHFRVVELMAAAESD
ncbi:ribonuclease H-like domain-containing protein [Cercophora scortea]|uniref:Ribonuclease H-like domain-containing protein n=1 Tax=Cercophora scortea TaxID=314031 RepID=A0AAE0I8K1_9PEZI|nr:ribonuclease H-like domain-containing protein [Cercophora scortea]